jgi:hypothetical protein
MTPFQRTNKFFEEEVGGIVVGPMCVHRVFVCKIEIIPGLWGTRTVRCDHCETDEEAVEWFEAEHPEYFSAGAEMRVYE